MSEKKIKKTRARAPEKKAEQFEKILDEGREMFVKFGSHGFSMRALARKLGMTQPNLYNYVKSKRELWIAIRSKYFEEFDEGFLIIIDNHKGDDFIALFMSIAEFFLDFMSKDYKRFSMMFLSSAPRSEKVGPREKRYKLFGQMKMIYQVVVKAQKTLGLKDERTPNFLYYLFSQLLGAAWTEANLKLRSKISEPITGEFYDLPSKEFRDFVLNEIRNVLERILNP